MISIHTNLIESAFKLLFAAVLPGIAIWIFIDANDNFLIANGNKGFSDVNKIIIKVFSSIYLGLFLSVLQTRRYINTRIYIK